MLSTEPDGVKVWVTLPHISSVNTNNISYVCGKGACRNFTVFTNHQIGFVLQNGTAQRDGLEQKNGINQRVHCAPNIAHIPSSLPQKRRKAPLPPFLLLKLHPSLSSPAHLFSHPPSFSCPSYPVTPLPFPPSLPPSVSPPIPLSTFACHTAAVGRWKGRTWRPL